jgi:hypothetical protein
MTPPNNGSDDEDNCGRVVYNGYGVDKKTPEKIDALINIMRNMASIFFNWECTLPFNAAPSSRRKNLCKLDGLCKPKFQNNQQVIPGWSTSERGPFGLDISVPLPLPW